MRNDTSTPRPKHTPRRRYIGYSEDGKTLDSLEPVRPDHTVEDAQVAALQFTDGTFAAVAISEAEIVRRWNAHDDLVKALRRSLVALDNMERVLRNRYVHRPHYDEAREAARAALAKAREGA